MKKLLLIGVSVVALPLAALAQDKGGPGGQGKDGGPAVEQGRGGNGGAGGDGQGARPPKREGGPSQTAPPAGKAGKADEPRQGASKRDDGSSQSENRFDKKDREGRSQSEVGKADKSEPSKAESKADKPRDGSGSKSAEDGKSDRKAFSEVTPEQKTRVRTAFSKFRVAPATGLDISISVGTRVPRTVKFYPVPSEVVVIAPAYRGFLYFIVGDQVVIVDPASYEIVDILVIVA